MLWQRRQQLKLRHQQKTVQSEEVTEALPIDEGGDAPMAAMMGGGDSGSESKGMSSSKSYSSDQALVSPFDGSLNLSYPLFVPPGRGGLQPDISLRYNSALTEHEWFGYGWSTNIPSIRRLNKSGSEKLYVATSSTFYSSLTGELVQVASTTEYRARVETGAFLKHIFLNNTWVVTDKIMMEHVDNSSHRILLS